MTRLAWSNITVSLGNLKPWANNPKFSTKAQALRIIDSFEKFGQVMTVAVSPTLDVYDGHQRLSALLTIHGADYQIDARQSNRPLTDAERRELVITLHTAAVGSYDWQALSGWDTAELKGWGMDSDVLKGWGQDYSNLKGMIESEQETSKTENEIIPEQYAIIIRCETEQAQVELLDRFISEGIQCRALIS
ncbi:MAG: hypothetical protein M3R47_17645 [Chloroflexota bacterium]|nr:hypothetical protein [Chloroflexota bacterium]